MGSESVRGDSSVTRLLNELGAGDERAADRLLPLVYDELRRLARARMASERPGQTLQPTALVHEAYLRLVGGSDSWHNRGHFFAAAAEAMRRILIERSRRLAAQRRGSSARKVTMPELFEALPASPEEMLAVDQALARLEQHDPDLAEVAKLRCFVGLTANEIAELHGSSRRTVTRQWTAARAWLYREMGQAT